jgi:hypothetical protein
MSSAGDVVDPNYIESAEKHLISGTRNPASRGSEIHAVADRAGAFSGRGFSAPLRRALCTVARGTAKVRATADKD